MFVMGVMRVIASSTDMKYCSCLSKSSSLGFRAVNLRVVFISIILPEPVVLFKCCQAILYLILRGMESAS